jgi:tetratricopeptide (TPR) repeat protein
MFRPLSALVGLAILGAGCSISRKVPSAENAYVNSQTCAACHAGIAQTYRRTGMARSFSAISSEGSESQPFYHQTSQTWFQMVRHPDGIYQRRWQIGYRNQEENAEELKVDWVMGSGNHVRTYLHRTARGTLIELPLAWYAEKGGYWALNPGYDSVTWPTRRRVGYDCMFCHNAYPAIPPGHEYSGAEPVFSDSLPQGIDCQRCHGPGQKHVAAARSKNAAANEIRASIVNTARLAPARRMEVCMQCHLETTSTPLPDVIRRFDRGPFSYRAGEPLSSFEMFFDHAPGTGHEAKFEIVNSAYRLRQSRCYLQSNEKLTCLTCHNPHDVRHGSEASAHYNAVCRQCHRQTHPLPNNDAFGKLVASRQHPASANCTDCHMPKRRTEDVVHAVMTDHLIQRLPAVRNPLAELDEHHGDEVDYHGEVVPYYDGDPLYTADAQLVSKSNVEAGISRLEAEIARTHPNAPEPYIELGDALRDRGLSEKAAAAYRAAMNRRTNSTLIARRLAAVSKDVSLLKHATETDPSDAAAWYDLGLLETEQGSKAEAIAALERAARLDPDMADAANSLGALLAETGVGGRARQSFQTALRIDPFRPDAHANLANLLMTEGDLEQSAYHFAKAVQFTPRNPVYAFNCAIVLARLQRYDESQRLVRTAIAIDPNMAEAHDVLGGLLERKGRIDAALHEYQEAVRIRPAYGKAHIDLGVVLAGRKDLNGAAEQFRLALADADPAVRREAQDSLNALARH